jgi:hypothetical protein
MLLPSRSRSEKIEACIDAWRSTREQSDLLVLLDEDDPELNNYKRHSDVLYNIGPRIRMCPTVNQAVVDYPNYKYYGFIGDDHLFRTNGWDKKFISIIEDEGNGWGIVYGDDLLKGKELATHCVISKNILDAIGYMAIPGLIHLYMDNFWMSIGSGIDRLFYKSDVIIEHMHFTAGKSQEDALYTEVNSNDLFVSDKLVFNNWQQNHAQSDISKIKEAMKCE